MKRWFFRLLLPGVFGVTAFGAESPVLLSQAIDFLDNAYFTERGDYYSKEELAELFEEFKVLADRQKSVSDLDLEALVHKKIMKIHESFKLDRFVINVGNTITTTSAVRLLNEAGEEMEAVTSSKFGPIDASYSAIKKIVGGEDFELVDFLIDAVTGGTDAQGKVTVKIKSGGKVYNGHAVCLDIVEAAVRAYVAAINNMINDKKLAEQV